MKPDMNIKTEWLDDGRKMRLLDPVFYLDDAGLDWIAKAGMVFDGASIPRAFWWLIGSPFTGKYRRAAVIHDQYYKYGRGGFGTIRPRKDVDKVFYELMIKLGVSKWRAKAMYRAVRLFGPRY